MNFNTRQTKEDPTSSTQDSLYHGGFSASPRNSENVENKPSSSPFRKPAPGQTKQMPNHSFDLSISCVSDARNGPGRDDEPSNFFSTMNQTRSQRFFSFFKTDHNEEIQVNCTMMLKDLQDQVQGEEEQERRSEKMNKSLNKSENSILSRTQIFMSAFREPEVERNNGRNGPTVILTTQLTDNQKKQSKSEQKIEQIQFSHISDGLQTFILQVKQKQEDQPIRGNLEPLLAYETKGGPNQKSPEPVEQPYKQQKQEQKQESESEQEQQQQSEQYIQRLEPNSVQQSEQNVEQASVEQVHIEGSNEVSEATELRPEVQQSEQQDSSEAQEEWSSEAEQQGSQQQQQSVDEGQVTNQPEGYYESQEDQQDEEQQETQQPPANVMPKDLQSLKSYEVAKFLAQKLKGSMISSLRSTTTQYNSSNYFHVGPRYQLLGFMSGLVTFVKAVNSKANLAPIAAQAVQVQKTIRRGEEVRKYLTEGKMGQITSTCNSYYSSNYFHVGPRYSIFRDVHRLIQICERNF